VIRLGNMKIDPGAIGSQGNAADRREYRAAYYQRNKEKAAARNKTPEALAWRREWRALNAERINAQVRARRASDPSRDRETARKSRSNNRARINARDARYREQNRLYVARSVKASKAKKPELYAAHAVQAQARRRAKRMSAKAETFTSKMIFYRDENICHLCGKKVTTHSRSLDHLIPICRGGPHTRWNVATAHTLCNQRRQARQILFPESHESATEYINAWARERLTPLAVQSPFPCRLLHATNETQVRPLRTRAQLVQPENLL
jgi:5-methylcytosine-specific restriction endonuclease McrA